MRKIVIANNKGGVAKTTTAYNLASYYAKKGRRVLVIDCDPQGNLTDALGIDPNNLESTIFDVLMNKKIREYMIKLPQANNFYLIPSNLNNWDSKYKFSNISWERIYIKRGFKRSRRWFWSLYNWYIAISINTDI